MLESSSGRSASTPTRRSVVRLLADENAPGLAVARLRAAGHDVVWVCTDAPGSTDDQVLAWARAESRLLLTFDRDFGELVFRRGRPGSVGVILFRLAPLPPEGLATTVSRALEARSDWEGHFSVVEPGRIRMRRLPD